MSENSSIDFSFSRINISCFASNKHRVKNSTSESVALGKNDGVKQNKIPNLSIQFLVSVKKVEVGLNL